MSLKKGKKILIIDDSLAICEIFSRIVEKEGHIPICAQTLYDGLELIEENDFSLVFLDIRLPDANGLEYIAQISKMRSLPEVIIITAFGTPEVADLAIKSGAADYLEKPSSPEIITLHFLRALERHRTKLFWLKMKEVFGKAMEEAEI